MLNIVESFIPKGRKNRPAKFNPCKYITIHNTGNESKGSNAKSHANYLKSDTANNANVSWHYTVDDNSIYYHIPESETAYHAGDGVGEGNFKSIGIEICMNSDGDILKATNNAVELVADICIRHSVPLKNIKQHNAWSGKNCPQMIRKGVPYNWDTFIFYVTKEINKQLLVQEEEEKEIYRVRMKDNKQESQKGAFTSYENAKRLTDELNTNMYYVFDSKGNKIYPKL